jgi:hypothetical protein
LLIIGKCWQKGYELPDSSYGKTGKKENSGTKKGHPIWASFSNILFGKIITR